MHENKYCQEMASFDCLCHRKPCLFFLVSDFELVFFVLPFADELDFTIFGERVYMLSLGELLLGGLHVQRTYWSCMDESGYKVEILIHTLLHALVVPPQHSRYYNSSWLLRNIDTEYLYSLQDCLVV